MRASTAVAILSLAAGMAPSVALPVPIAPPRLRIQEQPEEKPLPPRPQDSFLDLSPESSPTLPHTNSPRPPDNEGKHVSFADPPNFSYGSGKITRPYSHGPGTTTHPYSPTLVGSDRPFSFGSSANPPFVDPSPPQSPPQSHAPAPAPADPAKPKPSDTKPPPMGPVSKAVFAEGVKSFLSVGMATIAIAGGNALIGQPQPPSHRDLLERVDQRIKLAVSAYARELLTTSMNDLD